ncbi:MAG TPA: hypothetical protein VFK82_00185 [Burkholderiaceae bacterium]|nr:hypothetical protein [Burkholderiaceae bacterium]
MATHRAVSPVAGNCGKRLHALAALGLTRQCRVTLSGRPHVPEIGMWLATALYRQ